MPHLTFTAIKVPQFAEEPRPKGFGQQLPGALYKQARCAASKDDVKLLGVVSTGVFR